MWYWVYFDIITCSWNIIYFTSVPSNSSFLKSSYKRYSCNAGCRVVERLVLNSSRGFIVVSWLVLSNNNIFAQRRSSDFLKGNKKLYTFIICFYGLFAPTDLVFLYFIKLFFLFLLSHFIHCIFVVLNCLYSSPYVKLGAQRIYAGHFE